MLQRLFQRGNELEWVLVPNMYPEDSKENHAGKVLLPQHCLMTLVEKQVNTPYAFKVSAHGGISYTHAGVHEFTEEVGDITLPKWMYEQLSLDGSPVTITCIELPKGKFIRLLPQSKDFLEIDNPKIALEESLRNYQVLSPGDTISLYFRQEFKNILFTVSEINPPGEGISIIDTDLEVEFLPPTDYECSSVQEGHSLITNESIHIYLKDPFYGSQKALGVLFVPVPRTPTQPSTPPQ
ncbi:ubiquitin fusion degradation protein 1 [Nematocida sp. LUAm3]|nr:ubiquitin fusion degradation protein 1 [Nematocida sp. LUAm3]KAI5176130.1 ubiquitin fusion degradation protein 1 [Nematocida sp. LUAm2]KAI5179018.1 ubiquitin fusion degradation protein 1 [Nematocida sp. LUAm1]